MNVFHHRRWCRPFSRFKSKPAVEDKVCQVSQESQATQVSELDLWRDASDWVRNQVMVTFRHKAILSRLEPVMHGVANVDLTDQMLVIVLPRTMQYGNCKPVSRSTRSNSQTSNNKGTKRRRRSTSKLTPIDPSCSCTLLYPSSLLSPESAHEVPYRGDIDIDIDADVRPQNSPCAACDNNINGTTNKNGMVNDHDLNGDTSFHSRTSAQLMVEKVRARIKLLEDIESEAATLQRRKWSIWPPSVSQSLSRKTHPTNTPSEVGTEVTRSSSPRWKTSMAKKTDTDNDIVSLSRMVLTPASG